MDRTGIGIEIVGCRADEEQSRATYEGEALNTLARVEHTHHHGNGGEEHDEGEEKSVVALRLAAYHFAARGFAADSKCRLSCRALRSASTTATEILQAGGRK